MTSDTVLSIVCFPFRFGSPFTCVLQVAVRLLELCFCFDNPLTDVLQFAVRLLKLHEGIVKTYLEVLQFALRAFLVVLSFCKLFHCSTYVSIEQVTLRNLNLQVCTSSDGSMY